MTDSTAPAAPVPNLQKQSGSRKRGGRFQPGQSGNPSGRKRGATELTKFREQIAEHVPEIITKLVEQAKAGDPLAARLLLERAVPAIKPVEPAAPLQIAPDGPLVEQGRAIIAAAAAGDLTPGQTAQLLNGLAALAKIVEAEELEARIAAMEATVLRLQGSQGGGQ